MFHPEGFPPELLAGPFSVQLAKAHGVGPGRLKHAAVIRLSRGIKSITVQDSPLALLTAPYTQVTGYSAASHATAFIIWELPGFLPGSDDSQIHISRQAPHDEPRRAGVHGHTTTFRDDEVLCIEGLWITSRVRTWLDCSRRMSIEELVVVADHLLRIPRAEFEDRSEPYATVAELRQMVERHKGTPGIQKARQALALARVGSDSAPESRLRIALAAAGLPEPLINEPVALAHGKSRTPDAQFPEYCVAVEYDGGTHSESGQVGRDIRRQEDFHEAGWIEVRIGKEHMRDDAKAAVRRVRDALYSRGWRPKPI
ncbi:hypothetical protein ACX80E_04920 [Arthrobacter sp. TMN-49]